MAREPYVRPPLIAAEPRSAVVALWRYRLGAGIVLLVVLLALVWLFLRFSGVTNGEDPGFGAALQSTSLSVAQVP